MKDYQKHLEIPESLKNAYSGSLVPVSEIFQSIQGEGRSTGQNSVFLKVECADVTDAERAKALLIENGFKMVTVL